MPTASTTTANNPETAAQIAQAVTGSTSTTAGLGGLTTNGTTTPLPTATPMPGAASGDAAVSSRVSSLLASDSPLMRQAKAQGLQTASRRGLGNSSMAAQASQAAMLGAATPIASQEAQQQAQAELTAADMTEKARLQREQLASSSATAAAQIAADERARLTAALSDLSGQRFNALSNVAANHKIKSDARNTFNSSINDQYTSTLNYMQNLYGVTLNNSSPTPAAAA